MDRMNILITLDRNYLPALRVLLCSMLINNPGEAFAVHIVSDALTPEDLAPLMRLCARFDATVSLLPVEDSWFRQAPTLRYYSRAMYYRLLAAPLLPDAMDRILYLDPDMLVIGPLRPLYDTALGGALYGACIHKGLVNLTDPVNRIRLSTYEAEGYFNSGMLLMNLPLIRRDVRAEDVFDYTRKNRQLLVLPDQDILNGLYGSRILPLDECLWNYDARRYNEYLLASQGERDVGWVMRSTSILHFCGRRKPWNASYRGRFGALYKHYMQLTARYEQACTPDVSSSSSV